jgi:riboflavin kinase/FMN adenylyltransferase
MDGFDGDLYGQILDISFAHFLRPTLKFDGLDALITQMRLDVREAESLLDS